ncbi:MAG: hypothetical protein PHU25_21585, partial [Deltaproteobacteria bacterium]|nr:hypothetical protein [Deltaproteobacteria bacterium]
KAEKEARKQARADEAARRKAEREARRKAEEPELITPPAPSEVTPPAPPKTPAVAPVQPAPQPAAVAGEKPASLDDLLFKAKTGPSSERVVACRGLAAFPDDRSRLALEERMLTDINIQVRLAAVDSLLARKSVASVEAMRRAAQMASSSAEKARITEAIGKLGK